MLAQGSEFQSQRVSKKLTITGNYDLFVLTIIFSRWFLFVRTYLTLLKELLFWDLPFLILFKELIIQKQDLKISICDYLSVWIAIFNGVAKEVGEFVVCQNLLLTSEYLKAHTQIQEQSQRQKSSHFRRPPFLPADTCWQGRRWELSWRHLLPSQPSLLRSSWKSENNRRDQNLDYFLMFFFQMLQY